MPIIRNGDDLAAAFLGMDLAYISYLKYAIRFNAEIFFNAECDLTSMLEYFLNSDYLSDAPSIYFFLLAIKQKACAYPLAVKAGLSSCDFAKKALTMNSEVWQYLSGEVKQQLSDESIFYFAKNTLDTFFRKENAEEGNVVQPLQNSNHSATSGKQPSLA